MKISLSRPPALIVVSTCCLTMSIFGLGVPAPAAAHQGEDLSATRVDPSAKAVEDKIEIARLAEFSTGQRGPRGCDKRNSVSNRHVKVCFKPSGDDFYIKDRAADGRSAVVGFNVIWSNYSDSCRNGLGAGVWGVCTHYDFKESRNVSFFGFTNDYSDPGPSRHFTASKTECTGSGCRTTIPPRYEPDPDAGTLHDFCTWSADRPVFRGKRVDWRGSCARHDLCYLEHSSDFKKMCDRRLWVNWSNTCAAAFPYVSPAPRTRRNKCRQSARDKWNIVVELGDG